MSHSDNKAKDAASTGAIAAVDTAKASSMNPYVEAQVNKAGQTLTDIDAGKFGGLPLVQAVSQASQRARSWNPSPVGDAALAANAAGGSGYATQENEYRKRLQDNTISTIMPEAVQAERSNAQNVLFPGSQQLSAFELAKANALSGAAGQANNVYNTSANTGFFNRFGSSFFGALGNTLGSPTASFGAGGSSGGF